MVERFQQNWAVIEALDQRPHRMLALASEAPCVVLVRIKDPDRISVEPGPGDSGLGPTL